MATNDGDTELLELIANLRLTGYFAAASLCVLLYDHILCFPDEVGLMWGSRWRLAKILWNRYFSLIAIRYALVPLMILYTINPTDSLNASVVVWEIETEAVQGITTTIIIATVDFVLMVGTSILALSVAVDFVLIGLDKDTFTLSQFSADVTLKVRHQPETINYPLSSTAADVPRFLALYAAVPLLVTFIMFAMTVYKCSVTLRGSLRQVMPVWQLFLRDGVLWFFAVFITAGATFLIWMMPWETLKQLLLVPASVVYSTVASRTLLNIKAIMAEEPVERSETSVCVGSMITIQRDWTHRKVRSTAAASGTLPRPLPAAMHASSSSRPYAATRTSLAITGPEPQIIRCRPAHDVCVLFAYDELLVCVCAFANIASVLLVHDQGADSAPPSVLLLEPSPLRHAIATPLICISATSAASALTLPAPYRSTRPVPDVGEHIVAVVASPRAAGSSQPLALSIHKTSDALLAAAYEIPRRSDSAFALEPSLRLAPAVGVRVDVLLVTHAGEHGVQAACGGGLPVVSRCMRPLGALSSGVGAWCPRDGVRGAAQGACDITCVVENVGYAVERPGLCRAVCGAVSERLSVESLCELDKVPQYPTCPPIHLVFLPVKCLQSDFDTALEVQQCLGPQHTHAGPDASTAALRFLRLPFAGAPIPFELTPLAFFYSLLPALL
ncbi:hypothetical protein B0H14DRAFT_3498221 [Mycena olivaceomarginata]|nr:hypothetical protein B0H14DRAFT_3498221 [Mycena olivaceomarginata]